MLREPDAVAWVGPAHRHRQRGRPRSAGAAASRSSTPTARCSSTAARSLERLAVRFGHYPERRSDAKGTEPEAIAYAKYGPNDVLFVGAERGSFVAVFGLDRHGWPEFSQLAAGAAGSRGAAADPAPQPARGIWRDRHAALRRALHGDDLRAEAGEPTYPQIYSGNDASGGPIPWSALSGLTEIPGEYGKLQAVWDGFYAQSKVFTIDVDRGSRRRSSARSPSPGPAASPPTSIPRGSPTHRTARCGWPAKATSPTAAPTG